MPALGSITPRIFHVRQRGESVAWQLEAQSRCVIDRPGCQSRMQTEKLSIGDADFTRGFVFSVFSASLERGCGLAPTVGTDRRFDGTEISGCAPPPGMRGGGMACWPGDGSTRSVGSAWLQAGEPVGALMFGVVGGRGIAPGGGLTVAG